jgi:hypothetical protein
LTPKLSIAFDRLLSVGSIDVADQGGGTLLER